MTTRKSTTKPETPPEGGSEVTPPEDSAAEGAPDTAQRARDAALSVLQSAKSMHEELHAKRGEGKPDMVKSTESAPDGCHVLSAITELMQSVTDVGKNGRAPKEAGGFKFRSIEDMIKAIGPEARTAKLMVQSEVRNMMAPGDGNVYVTMAYRWTSLVDGSFVEFQAIGQGKDKNDKAAAKAMAVAFKYFLGQSLLIGTGDPDPDSLPPENDAQRPSQRQQRPHQLESATTVLKEARRPGMTRDKLSALWRANAAVLNVVVEGAKLGEHLTAISTSLPSAETPESQPAAGYDQNDPWGSVPPADEPPL